MLGRDAFAAAFRPGLTNLCIEGGPEIHEIHAPENSAIAGASLDALPDVPRKRNVPYSSCQFFAEKPMNVVRYFAI